MKTLVTHNGAIHADDLFAAAALSLYLDSKGESSKVIRSRDKESIEAADYVFDVGGIYDPIKNRFDHHQKTGPGKRDNGVPFASFGLIWKHFGLDLCAGEKEVWQKLDTEIVCPIDASDNGLDVSRSIFSNVGEYKASRTFIIFTPTWQEDTGSIDDAFRNQVVEAKRVLRREIEVAKSDVLGKRIILDAYEKAKDKRIVELPNNFPRYLYQNVLSSLPEPIYMICKSRFSNTWKVEAITKNPDTMESRKSFPESWCRGVDHDTELPKLSGVADATFCHRGGFLVDVGSYEGAIKIAEISLQAKEKRSIWHLLTK